MYQHNLDENDVKHGVLRSKYSKHGHKRYNLDNCRCSGYRGIPIHLLLGLFNGPASAQGKQRSKLLEKILMRRRLMRRTTT
jgi:hypothetical protein